MTRCRLLLLSLLVSACAGGPDSDRAELDRYAAEHDRELAAFQAAQGRLEETTEVPQRIDFDGVGTLLVDELRLIGRPGKAFLRVRYTYVNTTGRPVDAARVSLTLSDPATEEWWKEEMDLSLPYKYSFTPDSSYTSWFEMPTNDVERRAGWQWELGVEEVQRATRVPRTR